jgi:hypothetical protein
MLHRRNRFGPSTYVHEGRIAAEAQSIAAGGLLKRSPGSAKLERIEKRDDTMTGWRKPALASVEPGHGAASIRSTASPARPTNARSLLRYAPAFVLLAAVMADTIQVADTDLWMHVRFGQIVLHTGHLIRSDIFSYSAPGAPWFNHEWLADVVMALFYGAGGVVGLKLMKFLCAAATMALLAIGTAETGADYPAQLAALMLAALGLRLQIQFRPQLFDYIFLSALLAMLARESRGRRARLWLAIPMMAVWANLHGGFLIGLVVLGLYAAVVGVQDWLAERGWRRAISLGALTSAALLATLINPFGIHELYVVLGKFSEPILTLNRNVEFQSPLYLLTTSDSRLGLFYAWLFPIAITIGALITFALTPRREDFALMAVAVMMICASLYAVRNMAFAVIACTAPLAGHLQLVTVSARRRGAEPPRHDAVASASGRAQLLALALAVFLAASTKIFSPRLRIYMDYPVGAVAFMQRNHLSGNILSTYAWGGYIIWHDVPPSKVFFDSFDERYPQSVQYDYMRFTTGGSGDTQVLDRYPHDYVLVPASSYLDLLMAKRSDWAPIYRDPVCVLFARPGSAATARVSVTAVAPPSEFP